MIREPAAWSPQRGARSASKEETLLALRAPVNLARPAAPPDTATDRPAATAIPANCPGLNRPQPQHQWQPGKHPQITVVVRVDRGPAYQRQHRPGQSDHFTADPSCQKPAPAQPHLQCQQRQSRRVQISRSGVRSGHQMRPAIVNASSGTATFSGLNGQAP